MRIIADVKARADIRLFEITAANRDCLRTEILDRMRSRDIAGEAKTEKPREGEGESSCKNGPDRHDASESPVTTSLMGACVKKVGKWEVFRQFFQKVG